MATIERYYNKKTGELISCRVTVSGGIDSTGKQIRHRKTWEPPKPGMTQKQIDKAITKFAVDFEREIEQGYMLDNRQTFSEYAEYVLQLKERTGVRPRTMGRYHELMVRINPAIGHFKLTDIRPQHLNDFYKNLGEPGIRMDGARATARIDLAQWLKKNHLSRTEIAHRAGISAATVSSATRGKTINKDKAQLIAATMGMKFTDVFEEERDTSPLSNKTILEYHRLISTILSQAEKEMLIPYNPAAKATPPKVAQKEPEYFQPEQVYEILDTADKVAPLKWRAIIYLLVNTGCRRGEIAGLKWESVDLENGIITIERALLYDKQHGVYEGSTKNGKNRTLRIAPEVVSVIKQWRHEQKVLRLANGDCWVNSGYVFTQDNGDRLNPSSITSWLRHFSADNNLPHIHPHMFRHTAASTMIADGIDLVTTANELGHSNATTTAMIYAHQIATAKALASESRSSVFKHRNEQKTERETHG
jgi:integrase